MMFNRKLLSISIASVLLTSSLAASANTQKDEEEKDSVNSWGKWSQNYATAAGGEFNTGALAFASLGQGETGRNGQNEAGYDDGVELNCEAGALCGYASFYNFSGGDGFEASQESSDILAAYGVNSRVPVTAKFYGDGGEGGVTFVVTPSNGQAAIKSLLLDQEVDLSNLLGDDVDGQVIFALSPSRVDAIVGATLECSSGRRCSDNIEKGVYVAAIDDGSPVFHGIWFNAEEVAADSYNVNVGGFVFGRTSTLTDVEVMKERISYLPDMQVLRLPEFIDGDLPGGDLAQMGGALIANYSGHTTLGAPVNINVNFTDNTWGGVFNGGADSSVLAYQSSNGTSVAGHVGFSVNGGVVEGVNLVAGSDAIVAGDAIGAVTGSVNASFFGDGASHVAGIAEIVKTTETYENATHVTAFDTSYQPMGHYE